MNEKHSKIQYQQELDPYAEGIVSKKLHIFKDPILAKAIGILTNAAKGRNMVLIPNSSRAVLYNEVHELVCTTENRKQGETVNNVAYLAFIVFEESGVIAVDDILITDGVEMGRVIGFNEIHMPNHINIVIQTHELTTGIQAGWQPGTPICFKRPPS